MAAPTTNYDIDSECLVLFCLAKSTDSKFCLISIREDKKIQFIRPIMTLTFIFKLLASFKNHPFNVRNYGVFP